MRYHYQGQIYETSEEFTLIRGHAIQIDRPEGRPHFIWPEQVIGYHPSPKAIPEPAAPRAPRPTATAPASTGNEVTLAALCAELGIEPSLARRTLRKKMDRPGGSWTFQKDELTTVMGILRGLK